MMLACSALRRNDIRHIVSYSYMVSAFELIYAMISEILQLDKIAVARMTSKVIQGRRQQCAK